MAKLPITAIVMTRNNARTLSECLGALLPAFEAIYVVDSNSSDGTQDIAKATSANLIPYKWNGKYPKKKQWCLENLPITHQWIFYCDADEIVTPKFIKEVQNRVINSTNIDGWFVRATHIYQGKTLKFGMKNSKLALFKKDAFCYPIIDDLTYPFMGEIEGHYQPIPISNTHKATIKTLKTPILHKNTDDLTVYTARHKDYAQWEAAMTQNNTWPDDPVFWRKVLKRYLRKSPLRPALIFIYSYLFKGGFLDGSAGFHYAALKARYGRDILRHLNPRKTQ